MLALLAPQTSNTKRALAQPTVSMEARAFVASVAVLPGRQVSTVPYSLVAMASFLLPLSHMMFVECAGAMALRVWVATVSPMVPSMTDAVCAVEMARAVFTINARSRIVRTALKGKNAVGARTSTEQEVECA